MRNSKMGRTYQDGEIVIHKGDEGTCLFVIQEGKAKLGRQQFYLNTLEFFQTHEYHSEYGRKILQPKKELTERKLKDKVLIGK